MDADNTEPTDSEWAQRDKLEELHQSHAKLIGLHHDATARLNKLERRVNKIESDDDSDSDTASDASDLDDDYRLGFEENLIHEVRDVDFEHFKNRYTEKDGKYCIEVLVAESNLEEQVRRELKRRNLLESDDLKPGDNDDGSDEQIIHRVRIQSPSLLFLLHSVLENQHVNGSFLWRGQNRITFFRPFTWFIHAQEKMKLKLEELEDQFSDNQSPTRTATWPTIAELVASLEQVAVSEKEAAGREGAQGPEDTSAGNEQDALGTEPKSFSKRVDRSILERALLESYETLLALRCYISFVDKRIIPHATMYKHLDPPKISLVRYQDLSYLFQVGELVYVAYSGPPGTPPNPRIARVRDLYKPDATATYQWAQKEYVACVPRRRKSRDPGEFFRVHYYTLDYNGEKYTTVNGNSAIRFFGGQIEIASLAIFPLRFHPDREKLIQAAQDSGRKFRDAVASKHMLYCGWSRPQKPPPAPRPGMPPPRPPPPAIGPQVQFQPSFQAADEPLDLASMSPDAREAAIHKVNYVESDVIVDVKEAVRAISWWGIPTPFWGETPWGSQDWTVMQDSVEIIQWADRHRKTVVSTVQDRTQIEDGIAKLELNRFLKKDKFTTPQENPDFEEEDFALLPTRLYAYALRERKFFSGAIESFFKLAAGDDPFDSLKIDEKHIRIVQSVVWSHFQRKSMESSSISQSQMDQDLIRGKGRGLVILLHGAPGVGKTATAEAVALWHRKPLFVITCGDLGFTPQGVESSLSEIFRLAHLWDCILLLDEADVFLSQRETNALQRNALVSVFLRVLEYYNGILFLTTNRVGTLDEAFKSRVHLSLYYPALGRFQTEQIMRMNLDRLELIEKQRVGSTNQNQLFIRKDQICKFAVEHWDRHTENDGEGRWNGRQIRNAVQIAASLALYERKTDRDEGAKDFPPVLDERHFEIVEQTMTLFEGYMSKTRGGSATFIAKQRSERDDRFKTPQPGAPRDNVYEASHASGYGVGGYVPYQNRPQTPQYSGIPQPYPVTQHYPQHPSPSGPTQRPMGMSAPYLTTDSAGIISAQTEFYGHATHQHVPGGVSVPHSGQAPLEQGRTYATTVPAPSGASFLPRDRFAGSSAGPQGHEPPN
ncbi:hypothetical protein NUW58_g2409 [Xylaria curta]|uniref:Uncharacterized protein n=1 Tax=Xylaria curta TaxID=42375 RepID=A0ACC1PFN5_9PEZI|nr:hypothetical protein NUW58_g2409 [Xylaria curta]